MMDKARRFAMDAEKASTTATTAADYAGPERKRCARCGNPFGLIRRRRGGKQFCSIVCMEKGGGGSGKSAKSAQRWYEVFRRREKAQ
jgi:hypothetical protein